eukprot:3343205-Pleurochrysis_carterae.AAC.1
MLGGGSEPHYDAIGANAEPAGGPSKANTSASEAHVRRCPHLPKSGLLFSQIVKPGAEMTLLCAMKPFCTFEAPQNHLSLHVALVNRFCNSNGCSSCWAPGKFEDRLCQCQVSSMALINNVNS